MTISKDLLLRALRCTTHNEACDCNRYAYLSSIEFLDEKLKIAIETFERIMIAKFDGEEDVRKIAFEALTKIKVINDA